MPLCPVSLGRRFSRGAAGAFCALLVSSCGLLAQDAAESPVPEIATVFPARPGPDELAASEALPDLLALDGGGRVKDAAGWAERRREWRAILEHYAVGHAPPAPERVESTVVKSMPVLDGAATFRLVRLSFGPDMTLGFDVAVFTPVDESMPRPVVVFPSFDATPGARRLPMLPRPPGQGKGANALLPVEPLPAAIPVPPAGDPVGPDPQTVAKRHEALLRRGYAIVTYHYQDTGEDTNLRLPDGSWAYRTTRFFPAYPGHDWGLLGAWAWGMSRVADYLQTQPFADRERLIVTGHSRLGKAALIAGAFDERFAVVAPCGTGGGGSGAYRFSGAGRGGKEGLDEMMKKYPGWFSPKLHAFRGRVERLPFDQHAFFALVAPRRFVALEATEDPVSLPTAVIAAAQGARPVFELLGVKDRLAVNFEKHGHAYADSDWSALLDFADWQLRGLDSRREFTLPDTAP